MIRCRTCLGFFRKDTCTNIDSEFMLGKSIKEILTLFIPRMVVSSLVNDSVCSKCATYIRTFALFIERCLKVEHFLIEESIKSQREISKRQGSTAHSSPFLFISLPPDNENGIQSQFQPTKSVPLQLVLPPTNHRSVNIKNNSNHQLMIITNSLEQNKANGESEQPLDAKKEITNLQQQTNANAESEQVIEVKEEITNLQEQTNANEESEQLLDVKDEISRSPQNVQVISDDEIQSGRSDSPINYVENDDIIEDEDLQIIKDILKDTRQSTIISVTQSPEQVQEFLDSSTDINLIDYGTSDKTDNKRILFLGNTTGQCLECKRVLRFPKLLELHFKEAHYHEYPQKIPNDDDDANDPHKTFDCPFCETKEKTAMLLIKHLGKTHKVDTPFQCRKCGKEFKKRETYLLHLKSVVKGLDCNMKKCRFCMEKVSKSEFQDHLNTHRNIMCDRCGNNFLRVTQFNMHYASCQKQRKKKKSQSYLCPICGKLFGHTANLNVHMTIHGQRARNYICHMCPKTFYKHNSLKRHLISAHGEKRYECSICKIKVKTQQALISHENLKHTKTYVHKCEICGQGFNRGDYYRRHLRKHIRGGRSAADYAAKYNRSVRHKPVKCKYCLKYFKNIYVLRNHVLRHVKSMRFKCNFCDLTFANKPTRHRHQKRHLYQNFDLSCKVCWKRFDSKEELEQHTEKHSKSKKYQCSECGEYTASQYLLRHHMSVHVAQEEVEKEKEEVLSVALKDFLL